MNRFNDTNLTSIMEFINEVELFEHLKPALAKALNKQLPFLDIDASHLELDPTSLSLFKQQGIDGQKYIYLYMQAVTKKPQTVPIDIRIIANTYNIGFSFTGTILYATDPNLTKSFFEFMNTHFVNCKYEECFNSYHNLIDLQQRKISGLDNELNAKPYTESPSENQ